MEHRPKTVPVDQTADEILDSLAKYTARISDAAHQTLRRPLMLDLGRGQVGMVMRMPAEARIPNRVPGATAHPAPSSRVDRDGLVGHRDPDVEPGTAMRGDAPPTERVE